jgi:hypothetical protein
MSLYRNHTTYTQNELLLNSLMDFYNDPENIRIMMRIINGESKSSLRIIDWFVTNFSKKYYTVIEICIGENIIRFKVYNDYKLKLKAYSKKRFDPFCRWDRISIPCDNGKQYMETTIGQLNFFKWAIEHNIIAYIEKHYDDIERDMNCRNNTTKNKNALENDNTKTRKKREELSLSACKCIKKENVQIIVKFDL